MYLMAGEAKGGTLLLPGYCITGRLRLETGDFSGIPGPLQLICLKEPFPTNEEALQMSLARVQNECPFFELPH